MARNRQILKLQHMATDVLTKHGIFSIEFPANTRLEYQDRLSEVLGHVIYKRLLPLFLQAVIDDDRNKVAELLDKNPELLLIKSPKGIEIESQYTWLRIDTENEDALSIAAKRKQIKMIELLLPYYDNLEQTEEVAKAKADALSAWKTYTIQKKADAEDEIIIPLEYGAYAQSLIDVFKEEPFPNGVKGKFSEKTELALSALFNMLLPKKAVKLNDYIDPELFHFALHSVYRNNFHLFQNWDSRDAFSIRTIGLVQSVLTPETAKILCEGFYYVIEENRKISVRAESLQLRDGKSFYRVSRESLAGLGREYLCGRWGSTIMSAVGAHGWLRLENACREKTTMILNIRQQLQHQSDQNRASRKQSCCVIL